MTETEEEGDQRLNPSPAMFGGQGDEKEPAELMEGEGQQGRWRMESGSLGVPQNKRENCLQDTEGSAGQKPLRGLAGEGGGLNKGLGSVEITGLSGVKGFLERMGTRTWRQVQTLSRSVGVKGRKALYLSIFSFPASGNSQLS